MISKERLEKLIEQCATVYDPDTLWDSIGEIKLNKNMKIKNGRLDGDLGDLGLEGAMCSCSIPLNDLVETKEEAEWHLEFGNITRTERLELPTWEEFDEEKFIWFVDKKQNQCCLYYLNIANKIFINVSGEVIEIGDLTKENYILACRKCRELFLGE